MSDGSETVSRPSELPAAARRWLARSSSRSGPAERIVVFEEGEMDAQGRWLRYRAEKTMTADPFTYVWHARLRILPLIWVEAVDGHDATNGWGGAKMWGVRSIGEREGADVHALQLTRSIAELAQTPDLAPLAAGLLWFDAGDDVFVIEGRAGERPISVRFDVSAMGDITRASATRLYDVPEGYASGPWRLDFGEHAEVEGARIPTTAVATYDREDGPWEYLRVTVTGARRERD